MKSHLSLCIRSTAFQKCCSGRPTIAKKTGIAVGAVKLDNWNKLTAPPAALVAAGVKSLAEFPGIATYSTAVKLDEGWTGGYGAFL